MAHASRIEQSKLQLKKLKKQRTKRKINEGLLKDKLGDEEYDKLLAKRERRTYKSIAGTIIWDYEHNQLSKGKKSWVKETLNQRLKETPDAAEKQKIEVILKWAL